MVIETPNLVHILRANQEREFHCACASQEVLIFLVTSLLARDLVSHRPQEYFQQPGKGFNLLFTALSKRQIWPLRHHECITDEITMTDKFSMITFNIYGVIYHSHALKLQ